MKIALCQMNIYFEDKNATLEKAEGFIKEAAEAGAELIAFPEMTLTGFSMNTDKTKENGETKAEFSSLAKKYGIAAAFGWVRDCGERARNMYTVVDKNGETVAEYAKIHPFSYAGEDKYFEGGNEKCVFELGGLRIGIAICYDLRFPQLFDGDYDMFLIPANWPQKRAEHWEILLRARAIENQAYFAGINCVGSMNGLDYSGDTALYDPNGREINMLHCTEGLLISEVSADEVKRTREEFPVRADRRYEVYKNIK